MSDIDFSCTNIYHAVNFHTCLCFQYNQGLPVFEWHHYQLPSIIWSMKNVKIACSRLDERYVKNSTMKGKDCICSN